MSVLLNQSGEEQLECPLCMEPFEVDDLNFFPCTCGYQICRFCWHRIRTDENGLCPACRKGYPENPADFKPLSQEEVLKLKADKRHKDQQRKQKITENRKHLANVRVVQRNLVFVVGLPMRLADSEVLKKHEYFGKFGKIHKVVINQCTSYAGTQGPSASAYVTYQRADDALRAIQAVNNITVDGRSIKSSLGTTKYCSHFMKNQACPKPDCMYLHEQGRGDPEASFTKEEMQQGKHQEYEKKLHEQLINATLPRERKPTPSPPAAQPGAATGQPPTCAQQPGSNNKEAWPSLHPGAANPPGTGGSNASSTTSSNGVGKGENGRKQSATKNPSISKKRHLSGDDMRGRTRDKPPYGSDASDPDDSSPPSSLPSGSASVDSSDEGSGGGGAPRPRSPAAARLASNSRAAASLFDQDNNSSFFSSNSFAKVDNAGHGSGLDWGSPHSHLPDMLALPTVHPTEDWQAAFGFSDLPNHPPPPHAHHRRPPAAAPLPPDPAPKYNGHADPPDYSDLDRSNPGRIFTSLHSQFAAHDPTTAQYRYGATPAHHNGMPCATSKFFSEYNLRHQPPPQPPLERGEAYGKNGSGFAKVHNIHSEPPPSYAINNMQQDYPEAECYRGNAYPDPRNGGSDEAEEGDDWGFDMFQETQKALAEMMEKEARQGGGPPQQQQQQQLFQFGQPPPLFGQQQLQQNHRLSGNNSSVSGCSRLLDGLGLGPAPQRSRLPPPGFSPAPNHMNAFGLGIPRAPTNSTGSKILPFMNLNSQPSPSPSPQPHNPHMFPPPHSPRSAPAPYNVSKHQQPPPPLDLHWADNLRVFAASPPPPPAAPQHPPHTQGMYASQQHAGVMKGWTGPCTDWTALDPAIVSSTRPPTHPHNTSAPAQQQQQHQHSNTSAQHWLRHLEDNSSLFFGGANVDWAAALSAPPPGFSLRQQAQAAGINTALAAGAEMTKIENL